MIGTALLALSLLAAPAKPPAGLTPEGPVFPLSGCAGCRQSPAEVAGGAPGTFTAVWTDLSASLAAARTFDTQGNPGTEHRIGANTRAGGVSAGKDGSFAIAWQQGREIFVQRLGPTGNSIGNPAVPNRDQANQVEDVVSSVVQEPDGTILAAWDRFQPQANPPVQILGRRVDPGGGIGPDIGFHFASGLTHPVLCTNEASGTLAAWTQRPELPGDRPTPAGISLHSLRNVNARGEFDRLPAEILPPAEAIQDLGLAIACAPDGGFALAWHSRKKPAKAGLDIVAQRFNAQGAKVGPPVRVNAVAAGDQTAPALLFESNGRLLVVWASATKGKGEVRGRRLAANGRPAGPEFTLHKGSAAVREPAVASVGERGQIVVVWNEGERNFGRIFR